eukprot:766910-Hanusia_phi.AAC.1
MSVSNSMQFYKNDPEFVQAPNIKSENRQYDRGCGAEGGVGAGKEERGKDFLGLWNQGADDFKKADSVARSSGRISKVLGALQRWNLTLFEHAASFRLSALYRFDRTSGKKTKLEPAGAGGVKRAIESSLLPDGSLAADAVLASEVRFGSKGEELSYYSKDGHRSDGGARDGGTASSGMLKLKRIMYATFLPSGYPASLPDEYTKYQAYNLLQDLTSNLRGILSTQKILEGMGVGKAGVTSLAATMQWMARDGSSMLGGLLFTAFASSSFGIHIKRWRLFADLINDVALLLDMLAPAYPELFLPIICLSSVFKAMCGVSAGACNAAIVQHWATRFGPASSCCVCLQLLIGVHRGNIADVGAKTGAQHTIVSVLVGRIGKFFTTEPLVRASTCQDVILKDTLKGLLCRADFDSRLGLLLYDEDTGAKDPHTIST